MDCVTCYSLKRMNSKFKKEIYRNIIDGHYKLKAKLLSKFFLDYTYPSLIADNQKLYFKDNRLEFSMGYDKKKYKTLTGLIKGFKEEVERYTRFHFENWIDIYENGDIKFSIII